MPDLPQVVAALGTAIDRLRECAWHGANGDLGTDAWVALVRADGLGAVTVLDFCSPSCVVSYLTHHGAHEITTDPSAPGGYDRGHEPKVTPPRTRGGRTRGKRRD